MLVCRPFSCIFGYVTLVISVRNAVVSVRFNISEHNKTYVISVRIAVDKRVGMLSHEDSWGQFCAQPFALVTIRSTLLGIAGAISAPPFCHQRCICPCRAPLRGGLKGRKHYLRR